MRRKSTSSTVNRFFFSKSVATVAISLTSPSAKLDKGKFVRRTISRLMIQNPDYLTRIKAYLIKCHFSQACHLRHLLPSDVNGSSSFHGSRLLFGDVQMIFHLKDTQPESRLSFWSKRKRKLWWRGRRIPTVWSYWRSFAWPSSHMWYILKIHKPIKPVTMNWIKCN